MNLPSIRVTLLQLRFVFFRFWICLCLGTLLYSLSAQKASAQSAASPTLADTLASAPQVAGMAPQKYPTPFLITRVVPKGSGSDTCYIEAVTNGMSYDLFADGLAGCRHLPDLHAIQWGRRPDKLIEGSIELVYTVPGEKFKTAKYFIKRSTVITSDWSEDQ